MSQSITVNVQDAVTLNVNTLTSQLDLVTEDVVLVVESGGSVGANVDTSLIAGTSISALRCITTDSNGQAKYATPDTAANALVVGISTTAATQGSAIVVKTSGEMTDATWNWTKGYVYLGANGVLTQTAPTGGSIVVPVAKAITATTIIVDIDTTITTV